MSFAGIQFGLAELIAILTAVVTAVSVVITNVVTVRWQGRAIRTLDAKTDLAAAKTESELSAHRSLLDKMTETLATATATLTSHDKQIDRLEDVVHEHIITSRTN